ncbi:MAG: phosphatase PAP2 family protein [Jaaginema sp. PMC 1079.18]|nr:phosphatase PAP2 family protein [Jaaginema sp. PMC 1080.18]MEC4853273.1 phosphatase PAP2 family protein [Jaaginema sp. PMC 1079.18]MEC4867978.1 phosphatase PAP2 family protein [Jaaginema sp. PMC 1078.18]
MSLPSWSNITQQLITFWQSKVNPTLISLFSTIWVIGIAIAGLSLWGFAEIADKVLDKETTAIDTSILHTLQTIHNPILDRIMIAITFLGDPWSVTIVSILVAIILSRRQRLAGAITIGIASAGAWGLNFLLKYVFARDRPALWERIVDVQYNSFPSGHAMVSLVVYGFLAYLLAIRFRKFQGTIYALATLLIFLIGLSRLYLGVHWPTDVIAGYAAGLVWLITCILSLEVVQRSLAKNKSSHSN